MSKLADLTIARAYHTDATLGRILSPHFSRYLACLELPDRNNATDESCIPEGLYPYRVAHSPRAGRLVIWIDNVPGRTNIQLHPGNYTRQILGCGLPGLSIVDLDGDGTPDVSRSGDALDFMLENIPSTGTIRFANAGKPIGRGVWR